MVQRELVDDCAQQSVLHGVAKLGVGFPSRVKAGGYQSVEGEDVDAEGTTGGGQPLPPRLGLQAGGHTNTNFLTGNGRLMC